MCNPLRYLQYPFISVMTVALKAWDGNLCFLAFSIEMINNPNIFMHKLHHFHGPSITPLLFLSISKWSTDSNRQTDFVSFKKGVEDRCQKTGSKAQLIRSSSQESRERESEQTSANQTFTSTQKTPTHDRWSARISIWAGLGNIQNWLHFN